MPTRLNKYNEEIIEQIYLKNTNIFKSKNSVANHLISLFAFKENFSDGLLKKLILPFHDSLQNAKILDKQILKNNFSMFMYDSGAKYFFVQKIKELINIKKCSHETIINFMDIFISENLLPRCDNTKCKQDFQDVLLIYKHLKLCETTRVMKKMIEKYDENGIEFFESLEQRKKQDELTIKAIEKMANVPNLKPLSDIINYPKVYISDSRIIDLMRKYVIKRELARIPFDYAKTWNKPRNPTFRHVLIMNETQTINSTFKGFLNQPDLSSDYRYNYYISNAQSNSEISLNTRNSSDRHLEHGKFNDAFKDKIFAFDYLLDFDFDPKKNMVWETFKGRIIELWTKLKIANLDFLCIFSGTGFQFVFNYSSFPFNLGILQDINNNKKIKAFILNLAYHFGVHDLIDLNGCYSITKLRKLPFSCGANKHNNECYCILPIYTLDDFETKVKLTTKEAYNKLQELYNYYIDINKTGNVTLEEYCFDVKINSVENTEIPLLEQLDNPKNEKFNIDNVINKFELKIPDDFFKVYGNK